MMQAITQDSHTAATPSRSPLADHIWERQFKHEKILLQELAVHHNEALPSIPTAPTKTEVVKGLKRTSRHMQHKNHLLTQQFDQPYKKQYIPDHVDPKTLYPSKKQLIDSCTFGMSHPHKMFIVKSNAAHILLPVLKSGFVSAQLQDLLRKANPRVKFLIDCWHETKRINFRILQHPSFNWKTQATIDRDRMRLRTTALFHYDLEMAMVQRYCGDANRCFTWSATPSHPTSTRSYARYTYMDPQIG
jgi:hypothetical protein